MPNLNLPRLGLLGEEELSEKFSRIYTTGWVSLDEYHHLTRSVSSSGEAEEMDLIDRLRHAIKRGWVKMLPEES